MKHSGAGLAYDGRVSVLNRRISSPTIIRLLAVAVFLTALSVYVFTARSGDLSGPPQPGDGPDYDAIAFQLARGNGFSYNWDDPEYRAPYISHNDDGRYSDLLDRHGSSPTAYRPFLFPALMAISYKTLGRRFAPVRVMNCTFMALACVIAFVFVAHRFGALPGLISTLLFVFIDSRSRVTSSLVLADATACLAVISMAWCMVRTAETRDRKWAYLLGGVTALAFLSKSVFFFWMPFIAIILYFMTRPRRGRWLSMDSLRLPLLFVAVFMVIAMPWMVRNCLVLRRFEPLGTMGPMNLSVAYGDKAVEHRGVWFPVGELPFIKTLPLEGKSAIEVEQMVADRSSAEAFQWLRRNPLKVPLLAILKARSEWIPRGLVEIFILGFALLGFLVWLASSRYETVTFISLFAICTLNVAATWSAQGRFLIPVLPIIIMFSAVGMWSFVVSATELPVNRLKIDQLENHQEHKAQSFRLAETK